MELDRPAVDRVLRRASELAPPPPGTLASFSGISEEVLLAAAAEVGLDPGAVRVSLAIERLGPVAPATRADRVLGAPDVVIDRLVALDATAAIDRLDRLLVLEHQLRPRRTRPDAREWHRQRGTVGAARRVAKTMAGGSGLSKVARLQATASAVDEQRTVLRLVADRRSQRSGVATAGAVTGGLAAVGRGVRGGVFGEVDLAHLLDGDIRPNVAPQALFTRCLDWLGVDAEQILGARDDSLDLLVLD